MRILVVEDEKRIADFLCRGLQGAGYAVDATLTGAEALEHLQSADYDMVVLDLGLPDMARSFDPSLPPVLSPVMDLADRKDRWAREWLQLARDTGASGSRAEAALSADPDDRPALFAMCIAQGVATDYMALVEKRQLSSLSPAKRSNSYAQRLLKLDPKYYDAYLTTGFSEYILASMPFIIRWFVHFENVSGNKERGVENVRLVAREGHYFKPFAKILLAIAALREKRLQEARDLLADLARGYTNNPLFRTELAKVTAAIGATSN